jgi:hypothetical protein
MEPPFSQIDSSSGHLALESVAARDVVHTWKKILATGCCLGVTLTASTERRRQPKLHQFLRCLEGTTMAAAGPRPMTGHHGDRFLMSTCRRRHEARRRQLTRCRHRHGDRERGNANHPPQYNSFEGAAPAARQGYSITSSARTRGPVGNSTPSPWERAIVSLSARGMRFWRVRW